MVVSLRVAFTGVIGIVLVVQGGQDTVRIRDAAEKQAIAASSFAQSASDINGTIGRAEGDFSVMANSSALAIKATQTQMRLDQRAWIAIVNVHGPALSQLFNSRIRAGLQPET